MMSMSKNCILFVRKSLIIKIREKILFLINMNRFAIMTFMKLIIFVTTDTKT